MVFVYWRELIQAVLLITLAWLVYRWLVQKTYVESILRGFSLVFLAFSLLWASAKLLRFHLLEGVFAGAIELLFVATVIIFQPELRRLLLALGQGELFTLPGSKVHTDVDLSAFIKSLSDAVKYLSKSRTGALIVLETPNTQDSSYLEAGTTIGAHVSTELLLTLFHTNTPLHDGAVVIDTAYQIASAGVLLPLTEDPKLSWQLGTRHRAAIGFTEQCDGYCLVVSEETGQISIAHEGKLEKLAGVDELRAQLEAVYLGAGGRGKNRLEEGQWSDWLPAKVSRLLGRYQAK